MNRVPVSPLPKSIFNGCGIIATVDDVKVTVFIVHINKGLIDTIKLIIKKLSFRSQIIITQKQVIISLREQLISAL